MRPTSRRWRRRCGPAGVVLTGTVRESRSGPLTTGVFAGLTGFMALVAGALVLVGEFANPGIYVCGGGVSRVASPDAAYGRSNPAFRA